MYMLSALRVAIVRAKLMLPNGPKLPPGGRELRPDLRSERSITFPCQTPVDPWDNPDFFLLIFGDLWILVLCDLSQPIAPQT